jgi:LCP family protein required for cell wall assembly
MEQDQEKFEINQFYKSPKPKTKWRRFAFSFWVIFLVLLLVGIGTMLVYKTGFTFSQMNVEKNIFLTDEDFADKSSLTTPEPTNDRLNILLLGLRGEGDPNGGLLTDSIMVISVNKKTGQAALVSIPRDLYVTVPGQKYKEKINYVYAFGYEKKGVAGALYLSKIAVSRIIGLYINNVISVDHQAFKDIVDTLGGVDIYLEKPFVEDQQWVNGGDTGFSPYFSIKTETASTSNGVIKKEKWVFEIPAGKSTLDGNSVLYFSRARYSSSDFDRARRQQLILSTIKDKALSLGILANPVKIYQLLSDLGKNVRTDMTFDEIKQMIGMVSKANEQVIIHKVFDTTDEGLLYSGKAENGAYILLPVGDDFSKIQEACKNIFNKEAPVK